MFSFAKIFAVEVICFYYLFFLYNKFVYIKRIVMAYQKKESLSWCLVVQNSLKVALKRCDFDIKNVAFYQSLNIRRKHTEESLDFRSNLSFCLTLKTFGNWSRRQNHWAPRFDQAWVQMKTHVLYVLHRWKAMDRGSMQSSSWKFYKPSEFSWQSQKE